MEWGVGLHAPVHVRLGPDMQSRCACSPCEYARAACASLHCNPQVSMQPVPLPLGVHEPRMLNTAAR